MKSTKKLVTVVLPQQVLAEAKAVQKKFGISTLSSLLRTALEEKSGVNLKTHKEKTRQISFRVEPETVDALTKLAKQNGRSLADVVRLLICNVGRISAKKLSALAVGSRKKTVAKKVAAPAKPAKTVKSAKAAKAVAKPVASVKKTASSKKVAVKPVASKKSVKLPVPAAKTPVKASAKKIVKTPAKKPAPAKKAAVKAPANKKRR